MNTMRERSRHEITRADGGRAGRPDCLAVLAEMVDADADAIYLRGMDGVCRMANASFARVFGTPRDRIVGGALARVLPQATVCALMREEEEALAGDGLRECELMLETAQGRRAYAVTLGVHRDGGGEAAGVFGRLRDLSERKGLEKAIVEAGECETRRLAMEMHDGILQELAAVSLISRLLQRRLGDGDAAQGKIAAHIAEMTQKLAVSTRGLVHGLLPPHLCGAYFVENLRRVAVNLRTAYPVQCGIEGHWPGRLDDDAAAAHLYRIAREAMYNAARHSGCTYITVRLRVSGDAFALFVSDNGHGFSPRSAERGGLGLESMRYRAGLIGAKLRIESSPGRGTTVVCRMTLPE